MDIHLVLDAKAELGEGGVWADDEQVLYWVDIRSARLHRLDPNSGELTSWLTPSQVGSYALLPSVNGAAPGAIVALEDGFHRLDFDSGATEFIGGPTMPAGTRFNDGKCSPDGRFFAGTMDVAELRRPIAALYRLDPDLTWHEVMTDLIVSNGLGWSADGRTMYQSDSKAQKVWLHDYNLHDGTVSNRRLLCEPSELQGRPDGAAIDIEGNYWSAGISAGVLNKWSPTGELLEHIELPLARPTCPAFGGPDLKTIYVTSLRHDLPEALLEKYPYTGGIVAVHVDVPGVPIARFGAPSVTEED